MVVALGIRHRHDGVMSWARVCRAAVVVATALAFAPNAAASEAFVPLSLMYRACDHTKIGYLGGRGSASVNALMRWDAATVSADVEIAVGKPDTVYRLRLIQVPRPAVGTCNPGDPATVAGTLRTDGNGTGAASVQGTRSPGATGFWVWVDGPRDVSGVPEFYTSDYVTRFG
ncbi:hypothetical protein MMAG44476_17072 [Mycolicibacterium mageritense DSM 44476 = CIP 104973]